MNNSIKKYNDAMDTLFKVIKAKPEAARVIKAAIACGAPMLLPGIPGTGKTALMRALQTLFSMGADMNKVANMIECTAEMTSLDLCGHLDTAKMLKDGTTQINWNSVLETEGMLFLDEYSNLTPHARRSGPQKWISAQIAVARADLPTKPLNPNLQIIACYNPGCAGTFEPDPADFSRFAAAVYLDALRAEGTAARFFPGMFDEEEAAEATPVASLADLHAVRGLAKQMLSPANIKNTFDVKAAATIACLSSAPVVCKYSKENYDFSPAMCASANGGKGCNYCESNSPCRFLKPLGGGRLTEKLQQMSVGAAIADGQSMVLERHVLSVAPFVMGHMVEYLDPTAPTDPTNRAKVMVDKILSIDGVRPAIDLLVNAFSGKAKQQQIKDAKAGQTPNLYVLDVLNMVESLMERQAAKVFANPTTMTMKELAEAAEIAPEKQAAMFKRMLDAHRTISMVVNNADLEDMFIPRDLVKSLDGEAMVDQEQWMDLITRRPAEGIDTEYRVKLVVNRIGGGKSMFSIIYPTEDVEGMATEHRNMMLNSGLPVEHLDVYHDIKDEIVSVFPN